MAGGSPAESPISRWAFAMRVSESMSSNTLLPWSRKYSATAVAVKGARLRRSAGRSEVSTITTARHISNSERGLVFPELVAEMAPVPVVVGNTVGYGACKELMETGVAAVLVGVGPGSACTSREVLGIGVPQVTATMDCAAARDQYYHESGRYVPIITDGGIRSGGDLCKAFAAGADAVMLGSILAACEEAAGRGHHWGMATPHADLPRGVRVSVGVDTTLQQVLFGPSSRTDGTENLVGALKTAMGMCGARTIRDFQQAELVVAPSIKTEGKQIQIAQR